LNFSRALKSDGSYWKASFTELVIFANRKEYDEALIRIEKLRTWKRTSGDDRTKLGIQTPEVVAIPLGAARYFIRSRSSWM